jgi:hypothetical protein
MRTYKMLTCKHFIPLLVYLNGKKPTEYISTIWNPKGVSPPNRFICYPRFSCIKISSLRDL